MYQTELLAKREALADLTCEEISLDDFAERWQNCHEVRPRLTHCGDGGAPAH